MGITTNYSFEYPTVGGSENVWGTTLNNTVIAIDTQIKTVSDAIPTSIVASSITDTPGALGTTGQILAINSSANSLEFVDNKVLTLSDTPSSYSGQAGKVLKVNTGETGLEFATDDAGASLSGYATETYVNNAVNNVTTTLTQDYYTKTESLLLTVGYMPRVFTSAELTPSANQYVTLTHNLKEKSLQANSTVSQAPDLIQILFKCDQADLGYSPGDIIHWQDHFADTNSIPYAIVESGNTTQIRLYYGGTGYYHLPNKGTGTAGYTNGGAIGKWKLIVKAWAF